jgi:hypothetical protein
MKVIATYNIKDRFGAFASKEQRQLVKEHFS